MNLQELCEEIAEIYSLEELKKLNEVICGRVKAVRIMKGATVKVLCKEGDMVAFTSRKQGRTVMGTLTKKGRTRAQVLVEGITWTVPFSMLRKVDDNES